MGSKKVQSLVSFVMMLFMVLMINSEVVTGEVSCGDAVSDLVPCGSYLMGSGSNSSPTKECCDGARKLNQFATTTADRQSLCACLKQTGPSFGVKTDKAKQLPVLCKLKLNIPISPNVDCSKVQ
ncbi:non-specific lipid-transfer protein-like [Papaver somniferum]|nr:non-specific lipid-transfer protein-like [Papaver somniferum]